MAPPPDKKGGSKGGSKGGGSTPIFGFFSHPVEILFVVIILAALVDRLFRVLNTPEASGALPIDSISMSFSEYFSNNILPTVSLISYSLSAVFLFGIVWSLVKFSSLNKILQATYNPHSSGDTGAVMQADKNIRWERVLTHLNSTNPNDWKFSILEADIMLADLLETLQYHGETIADKLKAVEPSDFLTIESAWEAHKVRNMVAHAGGDFVLTDREARRVIELYRDVFNEFKII